MRSFVKNQFHHLFAFDKSVLILYKALSNNDDLNTTSPTMMAVGGKVLLLYQAFIPAILLQQCQECVNILETTGQEANLTGYYRQKSMTKLFLNFILG